MTAFKPVPNEETPHLEPDPEEVRIPGATYKPNLDDFTAADRDFMAETEKPSLSWNPDPGETIVGVVEDVYTGTSEYGDYPIVEIATPDGFVVLVHAFHAILKAEVQRKGPEQGDRIGITYVGREGKQDMARYRVKLLRLATIQAAVGGNVDPSSGEIQ